MLWPAMEAQAIEGIDRAGVEGWFEENVPEAKPPLSFERISGGRSNLTFGVRDSEGRAWALRRPPLGKRLGSAHDMGREHRVIAALQETPVPVPPVVGLCEDDAVNGAPFYVMGFVEGPILRSAEDAKRFDEGERREIGERVVDTLVAIHQVDPDAVGLGELGRKEAYVKRQLRRWYGQWEKSKTRELPAVDGVHERLSARIPEQGAATIVHGDYRLDNMIFHPTEPRLLAILDWELSTLGHPLADFTYNLMVWRLESTLFRGVADADFAGLGLPTEAEYVAAYCRRTGRDGIADLEWYMAYNMFRLAAILQGIMGRVVDGTAASEHAIEQGRRARPMAEAAWRQVEAIAG
jgi:aminoglycoside phosphotransferase (APT) family kinase protein